MAFDCKLLTVEQCMERHIVQIPIWHHDHPIAIQVVFEWAQQQLVQCGKVVSRATRELIEMRSHLFGSSAQRTKLKPEANPTRSRIAAGATLSTRTDLTRARTGSTLYASRNRF